jgi:hypothetical protein
MPAAEGLFRWPDTWRTPDGWEFAGCADLTGLHASGAPISWKEHRTGRFKPSNLFVETAGQQFIEVHEQTFQFR